MFWIIFQIIMWLTGIIVGILVCCTVRVLWERRGEYL